jgi:hydrogenase maturation protein HypF
MKGSIKNVIVSDLIGAHISISGIVQGVGFRPFVYGLANRYSLTGQVWNTSAGVEIDLDGSRPAIFEFIKSIRTELPPLANIDNLVWEELPANGYVSFEIKSSVPLQGAFQPISPDVAICPDCLEELFTPGNRRYKYPFINCTNCGPRFTIIQDIPYDRPNTTMSGFEMCPECAQEYSNPSDRRFHAQPIACPVCGPQIWLELGTEQYRDQLAFDKAVQLLQEGKTIAIKGLGGFHLACDATNSEAVNILRERKLRVDKPFALMMPDLIEIKKYCDVNLSEEAMLLSKERPIVILRRKPGTAMVDQVAPGQNTLGVMLPYTPLHYLLYSWKFDPNGGQPTDRFPVALVMTSGNQSEEPIAFDNEEARSHLGKLADAFLMHNRPIWMRCDDSVIRKMPHDTGPYLDKIAKHHPNNGQWEAFSLPIRRARGYAPFPVHLIENLPSILATGGELKNTFCILRKNYAFLSHHIGDMENYETLRAFEDGIRHYEKLFRFKPEVIAYDLHPNYLSTRYGLSRAGEDRLPSIGIQHHYAHIASCLAENQLPPDELTLGIAFDGTGYGDDGAIWGGEFLLASLKQCQRVAHIDYAKLPGGDQAAREPWRYALSLLDKAGISWEIDLPPVKFAQTRADKYLIDNVMDPLDIIARQIQTDINSPQTSSMGRLFDGIASLVGLRHIVNYEAQAAIELEGCLDPTEQRSYEFTISASSGDGAAGLPLLVDSSRLIKEIVSDIRLQIPTQKISARFHNAIVNMVLEVIMAMRSRSGIFSVVLSGGVWQNMYLLSRTVQKLDQNGFQVYTHQKVPCNDGGLSLGQAVIAGYRMNNSQ